MDIEEQRDVDSERAEVGATACRQDAHRQRWIVKRLEPSARKLLGVFVREALFLAVQQSSGANRAARTGALVLFEK